MFRALVVLLFTPTERTQLEDVRNAEVLTLHKATIVEHVTSLWICVRGEIDGSATIRVDGYPEETIAGRVHLQRKVDWYVDDAELIYTPDAVSGGKLSISYQFSGI